LAAPQSAAIFLLNGPVRNTRGEKTAISGPAPSSRPKCQGDQKIDQLVVGRIGGADQLRTSFTSADCCWASLPERAV